MAIYVLCNVFMLHTLNVFKFQKKSMHTTQVKKCNHFYGVISYLLSITKDTHVSPIHMVRIATKTLSHDIPTKTTVSDCCY